MLVPALKRAMATVPLGFNAFPLPVAHLSLPVVLKCGQSFRWSSIVNSNDAQSEWRFTLPDRVICLRQTPDTLYYRALFPSPELQAASEAQNPTLLWLRDYFQLDVDLLKIFSTVDDPIFQNALKRFDGALRMLRQEPWENLISYADFAVTALSNHYLLPFPSRFICSQNNHISRITNMVQNLCVHFSPPLLTYPSESDAPSIPYHPFPTPQALADPSVEAVLRGLGFGYRAKYIQKTAAILCETHADPQRWLLSLREMPVEQAREELLKFAGVGPKVADCILLMSLDKVNTCSSPTAFYIA